MKDNILFISDLHAHNYKSHAVMIDGVNSRLLVLKDAFRRAVEIGKENNCGAMIILGDVFHVRGNIKPSVLNFVSNMLREVVEDDDMDVYILAGNHDYETFDNGETAVEVLENIRSLTNGVWVIKNPAILTIKKENVLFIPYYHNLDEFKKIYQEEVKKHLPDIVAIHQGVDDLAPDEDIPRTTITADFLTKGNAADIFAGHYHLPKVSEDSNRVISVGSLVPLTFGEPVESKTSLPAKHGCFIYKAERGTRFVQFFPIDSPKFVTLDAEEYSGKDFNKNIVSGNYIRVKAKTTKGVDKIIADMKERGALSVVANIEKEYTTAHDEAIKLSTPAKMFSEYVKMSEKYAPHADKLQKLFENVCLAG